MDKTESGSLSDADIALYGSDFVERDEITESLPPSPEFGGSSCELVSAHAARCAGKQVSREARHGAANLDFTEDSYDYTSRRFQSESEESEPPRYHSLKAVPHDHHYPTVLRNSASAKEEARTPTLHLGSFWRKQPEASSTTSNSYRSIQESVRSPNSNYEREFTRQELVQEISERMSETYLHTFRDCGIPVVIKPRKAAMYTVSALVAINALALILHWAALFGVDPSPSIITYSLTIVLGISCVPSFFVFWACQFNPFAALSAFASTAFSGTFAVGLLEAFFVANNLEDFEDSKMSALGSAAAAFDMIASLLWLLIIIVSLIFYKADSQQKGYYVIQFIAFNSLAILILVSFLLTLLMDIVFFDKAGQIDIMYLAVAFSLLSVLFSFCFCFCSGLAIKERESHEPDNWSRFISLLPFAICSILTILSFICGILSMVIGTNLSHDSDYNEKYGGSVATLAYLVGTLNFGVSIATISVGCILGVHTFM